MFGFKVLRNVNISLYLSVVFIFELVDSGVYLEDPLLFQIYQSYIRALDIEAGTVAARRVFSNNKNYEIHIIKLDEVNGNKRHNLLVKESNASNPLIYINNPVETKVPHAYLTFEEFKKELNDRVKVLRQQFVENVDKTVHQNLNMTTEKSLSNEESKKFKIFLNRLMNLPSDKKNDAITNEKKNNGTAKVTKIITKLINNYTKVTKSSKTKHNHAAQVTKLKSEAKPTQTSKIQKKSKEENKRTSHITEETKVEKPVFRLFTLATDAKSTVKNTKQSKTKKETKLKQTTDSKTDQATDITDITETTTVEMETTTEVKTSTDPLPKTEATKPPTEPDFTKDSVKETPESTSEIEFDSVQAITTTTEETTTATTKRSTLGRPLVWVEADEKKEDE